MSEQAMPAKRISRAEKQRRNALPYHEQQADAEASCVPCKLCGGRAVIKDAGPGRGYYIECGNSFDSMARGRGTCLQSGVRLSGWAYNCFDMWNRLNATPEALAEDPAVKVLVAKAVAAERARCAAECKLVADRFRSQMTGTTLADASYRLAEAEAAEKCAAAIRKGATP